MAGERPFPRRRLARPPQTCSSPLPSLLAASTQPTPSSAPPFDRKPFICRAHAAPPRCDEKRRSLPSLRLSFVGLVGIVRLWPPLLSQRPSTSLYALRWTFACPCAASFECRESRPQRASLFPAAHCAGAPLPPVVASTRKLVFATIRGGPGPAASWACRFRVDLFWT